MTPRLDPAFFPPYLAVALQRVTANLAPFAAVFPHDSSENGIYRPRHALNSWPEGGNFGWTTSFWTGQLWLAYELSGDAKFRRAAESQVVSFADRLRRRVDVDHHDLGFLYTLSCVAAWRISGDLHARETALAAADALLERFLPAPGIIQAWGAMDDPAERGRVIVDSLMNLPLLYWASEQTGLDRYSAAAFRHAEVVRQVLIRPDSSSYHTYFFDPLSGSPLYGKTFQGFGDESCWARGQAWGIYGFALSYRYTRHPAFLQTARQMAAYFLAHSPKDGAAFWDLCFPEGSSEVRDSSASVIAACGMLEIGRWAVSPADRARYRRAAGQILKSLAETCSGLDMPGTNALLLHSVDTKPLDIGVDEASLWGDYFYLEALARVLKPDWRIYW